MSVRAPDRLADAASTARRALAVRAPELVDRFQTALPDATDAVARKLADALHREGLRPATGPLRRYAFNRVRTGSGQPALIADSEPGLAAELTDAVIGLALGYARRPDLDAVLRRRPAADVLAAVAGLPADEQVLTLERLATEGHNLHPCGRTRLGWSVADRLAHDVESPGTAVRWLAVRRDLLVGDRIGDQFTGDRVGPGLEAPPAPATHVAQPVHDWQLSTVLPVRYADLLGTGALRVLDAPPIPVWPTAALRTVLLPGGGYLKLSLDIQVTSTRRTISVASTRNGPRLSALLGKLLADEPRTVLLAEPAGAAVVADAGRHRDLAAIVRRGLSRLDDGEAPVPGVALPARCPITGRPVLSLLLARYAATRGRPDDAGAAHGFVAEYAGLLLPPLLRLLARAGIALEAHLQNCIPTFVGGVPHRMFVRDLAGLRVCLRRAGRSVALWPGSVVGTGDPDVARAKLAYTALQAHLGEVVARLVDSHGLDEHAAWREVRAVVEVTYARLSGADARADHAFLTAPTLPHKALVRMRLAGAGDLYLPVPNPLA